MSARTLLSSVGGMLAHRKSMPCFLGARLKDSNGVAAALGQHPVGCRHWSLAAPTERCPNCFDPVFREACRPSVASGVVKHALRVVTLIAAVLVPALAIASSSVFVTNNTPKPLQINVTSTLPSEHWSAKHPVVPAFSRREVFETNRDTGVTAGETFVFTAEVMPHDPVTGSVIPQHSQNFAIRLRLDGKTIGSHMWQSVMKQSGAHDSWYDDRQKHGSLMTIQGRPWYVTYWAYFTGGDDDVEYVFREDYPPPVGYGATLQDEWHASHLNVLSYNVYMRPTSLFANGQMIRAGLIPDQIPGYDVVVFQEAFDDDTRAQLLRGMTAKGYPYHTDILGTDRGTEQDGGVIIVSRWPIVLQKQRLFGDVCSDWDCSADKGVLYAKIDKQIKPGQHNYFHPA